MVGSGFRSARRTASDPSLTAVCGLGALAEFVDRLDVGRHLRPRHRPIRLATGGSLARRFAPDHLAGLERAGAEVIARAYRLPAPAQRASLVVAVSIDMDSTDVEVYGSRRQDVAYTYAGQRATRPHLSTWAEAGLTMAAGLLAGNDDVRPRAAGMLRRAAAGVPDPVLSAVAEAGSRPLGRL